MVRSQRRPTRERSSTTFSSSSTSPVGGAGVRPCVTGSLRHSRGSDRVPPTILLVGTRPRLPTSTTGGRKDNRSVRLEVPSVRWCSNLWAGPYGCLGIVQDLNRPRGTGPWSLQDTLEVTPQETKSNTGPRLQGSVPPFVSPFWVPRGTCH